MAWLLSGSVTAFLLAIGALLFFSVLVLTGDERTPTATAGRDRPQPWRRWTRIAAFAVAGIVSFFVLFGVGLSGIQRAAGHRDESGRQARQALYDACLERTTPEVCEVHWVQQSGRRGDESAPALVIAPNGKVGTVLGL